MSLLLYRGEEFNPNFYYHSGVDIDHAFFLKMKSKTLLLVPEMNREYAESVSAHEVLSYGKKPLATLKSLLGASAPLRLDMRSLRASLHLKLSKIFRTKDASDELAFYRSIKRKDEISLLKKASALSKKLIRKAGRTPENTEAKTASSMVAQTYMQNSSPAFSPIVASGKNSSYPHSTPTKKRISSPLMIDYGATHEKYCGDITRCFRLDGEQGKNYAKLKRISALITDEIPNLRTGSEISALSIKLYKKEELPYPPHGIGHGIGLEVHERPSLSSHSRDSIINSAFTIEPSVYFAGKYGLRYENTIHFDGKKARVL
jgi:Xaa-Pro aminopeptidase